MRVRLALTTAFLLALPGVGQAGHPAPAPATPTKTAPAPAVPAGYPEGADVKFLTRDGSAVGPLDKLRVAGKYTVFDVYADWCGPCAEIDEHLRELAASRKDLAIRKLNVVDFDSPLGRELGPRFDTLPYLIVFTPEGRRRTLKGADSDRLDALLGDR